MHEVSCRLMPTASKCFFLKPGQPGNQVKGVGQWECRLDAGQWQCRLEHCTRYFSRTSYGQMMFGQPKRRAG